MDGKPSTLKISSLLNSFTEDETVREIPVDDFKKGNKFSLSNILNSSDNDIATTNVNSQVTNNIKSETVKVEKPIKQQQRNVNNYLYAQPRSRSFANPFDLNLVDKTKLTLTTDSTNNIKIYHENSQLYYTLPEGSVPCFIIDDFEAFKFKTPIAFYEAVSDLGEKYGAVKLTITDPRFNITNDLIETHELANEQFWFKTRKQYLSSFDTEAQKILEFHKDLFQFHKNIKKTNITKIPNIDKRKLDIYRLWSCVQLRGGFDTVSSQKLWAQIGRELGYSGRIMSSLSTSLRAAYVKVLQEFDLYREQLREKQREKENTVNINHIYEQNQLNVHASTPQITHLSNYETNNINTNKRISSENLDHLDSINNYNIKKLKIENPLIDNIKFITSSAAEYLRIRDIKYSKGLYVSFDNITEIKKNITTNTERTIPGYDFSFWNKGQEVYDKSVYNCKASSIFSVKQFYEKSQRNIKKLRQLYDGKLNLNSISSKNSQISDEEFEYSLDTMLSNPSLDYEIDTALDIMPMIHNADYILNRITYGKKLKALELWKLNNVPLEENSLLKYLDIDYGHVTRPKLEIGMHFSTRGWSVTDNFMPLVDYNHLGSTKLWYVIPPSEIEKFETLIKTINESRPFNTFNVRNLLPNEIEENFKSSEFYKNFLETNDDNPVIFGSKRKNVHSILNNETIKSTNLGLLPNDLYLKSRFLKDNGINLKKIAQDEGSFIFQFPKSYSSSYGTGFYLSENALFAPKSWLKNSIEGEQWLSNRNILPSMYMTQFLSNIAFNNLELRFQSSDLLGKIIREELHNRSMFRSKHGTTHERIDKFDFISDLSLESTGFSKVVISDDYDCMSISLREFLSLKGDELFSNDSNKSQKDLSISLHLSHDDDALTQLLCFSEAQNTTKTAKLLEDTFEINLFNLINSKYVNKKVPFHEMKDLVSKYDPEIIEKYFDKTIIKECEILVAETKAILSKLQNISMINDAIQFGDNIKLKILTVPDNDKLLLKLEKVKDSFSTCSFYFPEMEQTNHIYQRILKLTSNSIQALSTNDLKTLKEVYIKSFEVPIKHSLLKTVADKIHSLEWVDSYNKYILKVDDEINYASEIFTVKSLLQFFNFGVQCCNVEDVERLENVKNIILKTNELIGLLSKQFKPKKQHSKISIEILKNIIERAKEGNLPIGATMLRLIQNIITRISDIELEFTPINKLLNVNEEKKNDILRIIYGDDNIGYEIFQYFNGSEKDLRANVSDFSGVKLLNDACKNAKTWSLDLSKSTNKKLDKYHLRIKKALDISSDTYENKLKRLANPNDIIETSATYCYCRDGDKGGTMIECEICKDWYHKSCINEGQWNLPTNTDDIFICALCNLDNNSGFFTQRFTLTFEMIEALIISSINLKVISDRIALMQLIDMYLDIIKFKKFVRSHLFDENDNVKEEITVAELKFTLRKIIGSRVIFNDPLIKKIWERYSILEMSTFQNFQKPGQNIITGYNSSGTEKMIKENSNLPSYDRLVERPFEVTVDKKIVHEEKI
ncbi:hypothetical protein TPHA_0E02720 [Tetrapisispora phaffii CBS 4417]|uniref:Protein ECM5 n=1 Tax=Tetrapisispora phaffii (strain ATCC 24235 / CBS 4417 / NBRC 1672 / NRRL Y-8282 / UCD 70-5) TaxID=1071381 RepID=G8BTY4_TETPH|nr:hypothetical protein TPHA_0E02720 [Tetrapisispora phaffii CBS 4417]CCE63362.1 hypothetical protein TPHA_0E02720 [Tetrapisispora phaffii CBS 4417]